MQRSRASIFLVAAAALLAPAAPAEVTSAAAGGFVVTNTQVVPVDQATAWRALVEAVDRWWPRDHTWWGEESKLSIESRAGGCFCEVAGERQARHMAVVFVDPPHLLRMVGGLGPLQGMGLDGALDWSLEAAGDGTRLTARYQVGGYSEDDLADLAPAVDRVQGLQLGGLADYLRGPLARREASMERTARGTFEVELTPQPGAEGGPGGIGRISLDKTYQGGIHGTASGTMLTAMTATEGSAAYVAIERFEGTLDGRRGSFALQHSGTMERGTPRLTITVVPDSGSDQLAGLVGSMTIEISEGVHSYELEYTLP